MARTTRPFDGKRARALRIDKGMEVEELIQKIGVNPKTGRHWDRTTVSNVENGNTQPGLKLSHLWAAALGVPRSSLLVPEQDPLMNTEALADASGQGLYDPCPTSERKGL
jgi:transcriptional regulator with XRE-family HTH domain